MALTGIKMHKHPLQLYNVTAAVELIPRFDKFNLLEVVLINNPLQSHLATNEFIWLFPEGPFTPRL